MKKKDYVWGLVTGLMIALFIGAAFVCGKMLYEQASKREARERIRETASADADDRRDDQSTTPDSSGAPSQPATGRTGSYVLEDPEVISKAMDLQDIIKQLYVEDVSDEDIANGIYDGIMNSLNDPYADYYTAEEFTKMQEDAEGIYYGIGAVLTKDQVYLYPRITSILDNSPASESELRVDDIIYKVDGVDIYDYSLEEAVKLIKGDEGTDVTLTIVRQATGDEFDLTLTRRKVASPTVEGKMIDDEIGYIDIQEFDDVTVEQFKDALATVKGSDAKGLIIDLRGNPGGSLNAVVDIAGQLLPEGIVVYTEDKYGNRTEYKSDGLNELQIPLVVLVNGSSASASEILSGAIKDYGKGTIMGTTTYGKGIVQRVLQLDDGSAVKLTVSHYYTPNGNDIHKKGIEPDVVVAFDVDAYLEDTTSDNQLDAAIEYLKDQIH